MELEVESRGNVLGPPKDSLKIGRKFVYREGGRHDLREQLMVMESERASPMLRSIQSQ